MGKTINWQLQILTSFQKKALSKLCPVISGRGFYLVGGTAVALYLGHRRSVDLDFFIEKDLDDPLKLAGDLKSIDPKLKIKHIEKGTLHTYIFNIKTSFIRFSYPLLAPWENLESVSCNVASLKDLACMKLLALSQRGSKKDFIDIYALIKRTFPLEDMLLMYKEKFSVDDVTHTLYALSYFEDADKEKMPEMLWDVNWEEIKRYIKDSVKEFAKRTLT